MGDRGNVYVHDGDKPGVYLYTHWAGSELAETVQTALRKRWRWDDAAYLARIIFCEMVKESPMDETGYGISTGICDNEHPIIDVDTEAQKVRAWWPEDPKKIIAVLSFEDFIACPNVTALFDPVDPDDSLE